MITIILKFSAPAFLLFCQIFFMKLCKFSIPSRLVPVVLSALIMFFVSKKSFTQGGISCVKVLHIPFT